MFSKRGFTLVELIMIIVILGILAAVAIPKYYDLQSQAQSAAEKGVVGGVRAGIHTYFTQNRAWPGSLDSATADVCSKKNACFTTVLAQGGVTSDWTKVNATAYRGPSNGNFSYNSADGSLTEL
jgi:MSHA pilin protein MshA